VSEPEPTQSASKLCTVCGKKHIAFDFTKAGAQQKAADAANNCTHEEPNKLHDAS